MNELPEHSTDARPRRAKEYEDPHFHDDEGDFPQADDVQPRTARPRPPRKASRKLPARRHYED
jgi:hypothetical protein